MNKEEFLNRLSALLSDISEQEREEALKYYRDYFEDAGAGNEESVIEELGSPEEVAKTIKESLGNDTPAGPEPSSSAKKESGHSNTTLIIVIVVCIIFSPLIAGISGSLLGIITAAVAAVIALSLIILAAPFALTILGIAAVVAGIIKYSASAALGMLILGTGITSIGLSLIGYVILWLYYVKLVPRFFNWLTSIGTKKKGGRVK